MLRYENATPEDLRRLLRFIDDMNPQGHVMKEIELWVTGTPEFIDMNAMLNHFTTMVNESEDTVL